MNSISEFYHHQTTAIDNIASLNLHSPNQSHQPQQHSPINYIFQTDFQQFNFPSNHVIATSPAFSPAVSSLLDSSININPSIIPISPPSTPIGWQSNAHPISNNLQKTFGGINESFNNNNIFDQQSHNTITNNTDFISFKEQQQPHHQQQQNLLLNSMINSPLNFDLLNSINNKTIDQQQQKQNFNLLKRSSTTSLNNDINSRRSSIISMKNAEKTREDEEGLDLKEEDEELEEGFQTSSEDSEEFEDHENENQSKKSPSNTSPRSTSKREKQTPTATLKSIPGKWTQEEDDTLLRAMLVEKKVRLQEHTETEASLEKPDWKFIGEMIPHRTPVQCMIRYLEALNPDVKKGRWSQEEDDELREGLRRFGRKWVKVAEFVKTRTQRQCRTRWVQLFGKGEFKL